jgi:hypothetical protein
VDVRGETVLIDVVPPERKFDEFLPKAQKLLDSVKWTGTGKGSLPAERIGSTAAPRNGAQMNFRETR